MNADLGAKTRQLARVADFEILMSVARTRIGRAWAHGFAGCAAIISGYVHRYRYV
jgi:hypothetical protein